MHYLKPGDLVRVKIWNYHPHKQSLGVVCAISTRYKGASQTMWYAVWTPHGISVYFDDEVELVNAHEYP